MKRPLSVALLLLLAAGQASAMDRYNTTKMTCAELTAALQSEGKAILRYPSSRIPGMMRFEKYVPERNFCGVGNLAIVSKVPTTDSKACRVFRCTAWNRSTQRY